MAAITPKAKVCENCFHFSTRCKFINIQKQFFFYLSAVCLCDNLLLTSSFAESLNNYVKENFLLDVFLQELIV